MPRTNLLPAALLLAALTGLVSAADATYRADLRRTGNTDGRAGPAAGKVLWAMKAREQFVAAPVGDGDRVYVSGLNFINASVFYALDAAPGARKRVLWSRAAPLLELPTVSSPAVFGDALVFGDGMHQTSGASLYGLERSGGSPLWQLKVDGDLVHLEGSPAIAAGKAYVGGGAAGVLCVDPARLSLGGKEVTLEAVGRVIAARRAELEKKYREAKEKNDPFAVPPTDTDLPRATPAVAWQAGKGRWHIDAPVAVAGGRLLAASAYLEKEKVGDRALFCLDAKTGKQLWRAPLPTNPWGGPSVAGKVVVVTGSTIGYDPAALKAVRGSLAAFDLQTGKPLWKKDLPAGIVSCAALADGLAVAACTDGKLRAYALDRGAIRWTYAGGAAFFAPPALAPDTVYAADLAGVVHAVNLKSGGGRWRLDLGRDPAVAAPGMVYGGPLVHRGRLYVATCNLAGGHAGKPTAVVCIGDK